MKKYVSNAAWMMGDNLLGRGLGIVVVAIVARYLGPEEYGMYAYTMSMAALFGIIGQMGLDGLVVRELVSKPEVEAETIGTVFVMKGIGFAIGALGLLTFGLVMPEHRVVERWLFISASIAVLMQPINGVLNNWFLARIEARYTFFSNVGANLSAAVLKLAFVFAGAGVVAIGVAQTVGTALGAMLIILLFLCRGGPAPRSWSFSHLRARVLLSDSWMIFVGSIFAVIYLKIDVVMLRNIQGSESVGVYSVAAIISEATYFIPAAIVTTVFPQLVKISATDPMAFQQRLQELIYFLSFSALIVLVGLFVLGPLVIKFALGPSYMASIPILLIHLLALPFIFLRQAFSRWILISKMAKFSMISQGIGALLNVALNLVLIPKYGGQGAAMATVISYAAASYFVLLISSDTRPIFVMMTRSIFKPWRGGRQAVKLLHNLRG